MALGGNWRSGLRELAKIANGFATKAVHTRVVRASGEAIRSVVQHAIVAGVGPDGETWARNASGSTALAGLARTVSVTPNGAGGWRIALSHRFASLLQEGGRIVAKSAGLMRFQVGGRWVRAREVVIPARPILPEGTLPRTWEQAIDRAFDETLDAAFAGAK